MSNTPAGAATYSDEHLNTFLERLLTTAEEIVFPHFDLEISENGTNEESQLLDLLAYCSIHGEFANNGAKTRGITDGEPATLREDKRHPLARALGYHLRDLARDTVAEQFQACLDELCTIVEQTRLLTTPSCLAIDIHDWLFYGDEDTEMVANTNPDQGTDLAYKFVTACVVSEGLRFTVAVKPIGEDDELATAVEEVLKQAREWVELRLVFLDSGFYQVDVVQTLKEANARFVMRAPRFPSLAKDDPIVQVEAGYEMGGSRPPYETATVTRFTVPHIEMPDEKQTYFITNLEVVEGTAKGLAASYRRRWGIETSYRVIGDFLAKSRSTEYPVRLFYFMFAVTLYNLWVLVNRLATELFGQLTDGPVISAKVFGRLVRRRWMPDLAEPG